MDEYLNAAIDEARRGLKCGAILLYGIPKLVIGENSTFKGPESYLRDRGVEVEVVDSNECKRLMDDFIKANPALWAEDIGA